jgi:hypothetical protein
MLIRPFWTMEPARCRVVPCCKTTRPFRVFDRRRRRAEGGVPPSAATVVDQEAEGRRGRRVRHKLQRPTHGRVAPSRPAPAGHCRCVTRVLERSSPADNLVPDQKGGPGYSPPRPPSTRIGRLPPVRWLKVPVTTGPAWTEGTARPPRRCRQPIPAAGRHRPPGGAALDPRDRNNSWRQPARPPPASGAAMWPGQGVCRASCPDSAGTPRRARRHAPTDTSAWPWDPMPAAFLAVRRNPPAQQATRGQHPRHGQPLASQLHRTPGAGCGRLRQCLAHGPPPWGSVNPALLCSPLWVAVLRKST